MYSYLWCSTLQTPLWLGFPFSQLSKLFKLPRRKGLQTGSCWQVRSFKSPPPPFFFFHWPTASFLSLHSQQSMLIIIEMAPLDCVLKGYRVLLYHTLHRNLGSQCSTVATVIMPVLTARPGAVERKRKLRLIVLWRKLRCKERKGCRGRSTDPHFCYSVQWDSRPNLTI